MASVATTAASVAFRLSPRERPVIRSVVIQVVRVADVGVTPIVTIPRAGYSALNRKVTVDAARSGPASPVDLRVPLQRRAESRERRCAKRENCSEGQKTTVSVWGEHHANQVCRRRTARVDWKKAS